MADRPIDNARYEAGMRTRRAVLGDAHVNRAEANKSPVDEDFQRFHYRRCLGFSMVAPALDAP